MLGYIYIRAHPAYIDTGGAKYIKIGKASNIPERDATYATGELIRGQFTHVFEVPARVLNILDNAIKDRFNNNNCRFDGGTEFYTPETATQIGPYIESLQIQYRQLEASEIASLTRSARTREKWKQITRRARQVSRAFKITPRPYQEEIISRMVAGLSADKRGILALPCGVGKTYIALFIARELLGIDAFIIVGVPNILVQEQWRAAVKEFGFKAIITTYHAAHKYADIKGADMIILDEMHHVINSVHAPQMSPCLSSPRMFSEILNITAVFQLGLTATLQDSFDPKIFGSVLDSRPINWAIEQNIICDYLIYVVSLPKSPINGEGLPLPNLAKINEVNPLHYAAAAAEWQFNYDQTNKMVIYVNCRENAKTLADLLNRKIQCENYDGAITKARRADIMARFKSADRAALVCVYCLGEGWDFPELDAVLFAENMTSEIRIIQAALRASRKNKFKPNKVAKIIIPLIDDFKTIAEVIRQMDCENAGTLNKIRGYVPTGPDGQPNSLDIWPNAEFCPEFTERIKMNVISRLDFAEFTYERACAIVAKFQFKSAEAYQAALLTEPALYRHPHEPATMFTEFKNWASYLNLSAEGMAGADEIIRAFKELQAAELVNWFMDFSEIIDLIAAKIDNCPPIEFIESVYGLQTKHDLFSR